MREPGRIDLVGESTNQMDVWYLGGYCVVWMSLNEESLGYSNGGWVRWMFGVGLEMIMNRAIRMGGE